ncbi:MAG: hypothetical protein K8U57_40640 [Planctomycetes bacterium]|nr:hypothetical protein [Planctomycetota bacterium]
MFALVLCVFTATAQVANDPVVAIQAKYPVTRVTLTTNLGTNIYYTIPLNAPPELRRAVKIVELAERDVLISEGLQQLKLEIVKNERKLEALRTNFLAAGLQPSPGNGFGNAGPGSRSGRYYMATPPYLPESSLRTFLSANLAMEASTERALRALDNLANAQYQLHRVWIDLAFPERKAQDKAAAVAPVPAVEPVNKEIISAPIVQNPPTFKPALRQLPPPNPPAIKENIKALTFDEATNLANALAIADQEVQKRLEAAAAKRDEAIKRVVQAESADKVAIRREFEAASKAYSIVLHESRAIRQRWTAASERVIELSPRLSVSPGEDKPVPVSRP